MPAGDKVVVSKRSARPYLEDGMEEKPMSKQQEDMELEEQEKRASTSKSTSSSSQTSLEPSPLVNPADTKHDIEALLLENSSELRDAFHPPTTTQHVNYSIQELEQSLPTDGRPANFGIVVPGVYRSSFPQSEDYTFIESLKLKTIVTLVQKEFPQGYDEFIRKNRIQHHVFNMKGTKKAAIPVQTMKSILRLVLDRRNHPLLIHCNHGKHRTGCVIAIVRKLSGWEMGNIISEYKAYAEPKVRECDITYINGFDLAHISNLFRDSGCSFRGRGFLRSVVLALLMIMVWLSSGPRTASGPKRHLANEGAGS
ncbi:hypothetical protein VTK26DRAFT_4668 [Humicola hyalothermophila]